MIAKKSFARIFSILFVMIFMLAVAPLEAAQATGPRYAKPAASGTGDCSSWENACTLQSALTGAASGDEIWVAAGTYKPSTVGSERTATFQLIEAVAVYGGFAGTEATRSQRSPLANLTILSGDIDNNDTQTPVITDITTVTGNTTNSYHVVTGATGATLDGFTITAGNANGGSPNNRGGGIVNATSSPILTNLTFSGNSANLGGGMYNFTSSNPALTNVTFNGNSAQNGGGMYNLFCHPTLTNVTFAGNSATYGAGMFNDSSSPVLTNITFSGNSASQKGGGIYNDHGIPELTNVTLTTNSAVSGGGIYNYSSSPSILNTVLWGNAASSEGAQIFNYGTSTPGLNDSVVQGGYAGTNIISTDPLLGTFGNYGGSTQTIPLQAGSSAIDTGNDATCATTDQRGVPRPQGVHCDIGAFELQTLLMTVPGGLTSGLCESWANACELRYALTSALSGQEIWAAAGTYKPTADPTDRDATFQLKNGVAVYGGFAGTETARIQRNPAVNATILSGDIDNDDTQKPVITDITTVTGNTTNSYHVVTGATSNTSPTLLDGFSITAGYAGGSSSGGGMNNGYYSSPTLSNITFSGNSAGFGGGLYLWSNSPVVTNVTFSNNSAGTYGGGVEIDGGIPTFTNVTFSGNKAGSYGGAMYIGSQASLTNVTFSGNSAQYGGGVFNDSYTWLYISNTIFWGNTATSDGAQIYIARGYPSLSYSVIEGGYAGTAILTTDPKLGTLGNYGGFTQTIPLLAGSSAIDAGDDSACPATDQRGVARPQGAHCDIGAYEMEKTTYYIYLPLVMR